MGSAMTQAELLNPDNYKLLPFKELPNTQALNSKTFCTPPLGSCPVPELFDWHLANTTSHPLFVYADDDGSEKVIYWPEAVRAMHRAGWIIRARVKRDTTAVPFVSILGATGVFIHTVICCVHLTLCRYNHILSD